MPVDCQRSTSGGKGNMGMFIERDPQICAAGLPTAQPDNTVPEHLQHYLMKDEVDALMSDAIIPPKKPRPLPPLRYPIPKDKRNAGLFTDASSLINPPTKTKFQSLVDDFKSTPYTSYWNKPVGGRKDHVPMLPEGFDTVNTTLGKKTPFHGRLYDVVTPKEPLPYETPLSKQPGVQITRNYCKESFNPDLTFGHRTFVDKRGIYAKCSLTDDRVVSGNGKRVIINSLQANFQDMTQPRIGEVLAPYDNIKELPKGHSFGKLKAPDNLPECLSYCEINPGMGEFRKCFRHLNSLRKCLSKRFLTTFFSNFYLELKYFDKNKTGWLPKKVVYDYCKTKFIRFDPALIEPLLSMWKAFDGSQIEYKTFVHIINYREPSPDMPKIPDIPDECIQFSTTYQDGYKEIPTVDKGLMSGVPSGRYLDVDVPFVPPGCIRADKVCLPHESDVKSCLNPSVFTRFDISHRDMYAKREPNVVRKVFEAAGENLSDEKFQAVCNEAQKRHSQGWVCFETFRQALVSSADSKNDETVIALGQIIRII